MLVKADLKLNQDKLKFVCPIVAINKKIATQSLLSYQSARHTMNGRKVEEKHTKNGIENENNKQCGKD